MDKIRVGLVGFGSSAKTFHLPFLQALPQSYEVTAVVDRKGEDSRKLLPAARIYTTWQELARASEVDLAVVCLPNALHAEVTCGLLRAGKNVVVEKPMANTPAEALQMQNAARASGKVLTVFHSRRLDGDFLTVQELLSSGRLGRLVRAEIRYDRWSNVLRKKAWKETGREGDTLLEDLGSHLIDQALNLWGRPEAISCRLGIQRDGSRAVDAFRVSMSYPGLWVDLEASMIVRASPFHWALHGTQGTFIKKGMDPQEARLLNGELPTQEGFGRDDKENFAVLSLSDGTIERLPTLEGKYKDFYGTLPAALQPNAANPFSSQAGKEVVDLLDLCRKSAKRESRFLKV
ncbi:MAG: Gfo/Idh/MocA family oxidoreductase [Spirochaetales bacterium]|nr:Gfo/Idh/MocA family oxidoreductase [Spirochaetales bacterium]